MKEYSALDNGNICGLRQDRINYNKPKYAFLDPKFLRDNSPRDVINFLLGDRFTGDITQLNQNTLKKISDSLSNFIEYKKTIQILPIEIYHQISEEFLTHTAQLKNKDRIDDEDYKLLEEKFSITMDNIEDYESKLIAEGVIIDNKNKVNTILSDISPIDYLRKNSLITLDQNNEIEDSVGLNKLTTLYTSNNDKKKITDFFNILIGNNPDYFINNACVNNVGSYFITDDLLELLDIYININDKSITDIQDIAQKKNINTELFMNYIFSHPGLINIDMKIIFGVKKKFYTLNTDIFS